MKKLGIFATLSAMAAADQRLFLFDLVTPGSSVPTNLLGVTNASYYPAGPGMVTPFGMRQMNMRGREMRKRYITGASLLSPVANPQEYWAYAIDTERTYSSAVSYMTGFFPAGGPTLLVENQTAIALPAINVTNFSLINATLNMQALPNNFQTVPIHGDAGNYNSTVFQGYDPTMCPIVGEIQMYNLATSNSDVNRTFGNYHTQLYKLFSTKGLVNLPPQAQMTIEDYRAIVQELLLN
jgi:hypothetical protein